MQRIGRQAKRIAGRSPAKAKPPSDRNKSPKKAAPDALRSNHDSKNSHVARAFWHDDGLFE